MGQGHSSRALSVPAGAVSIVAMSGVTSVTAGTVSNVTMSSVTSVPAGAVSDFATNGVTDVMMNDFHLFAQYTAASYCNADPLQAKTSISCGANACSVIQAHDTHIVVTLEGMERETGGYIALDNTDRRIVVAYRGTNSPQDWLSDARASLDGSDLCSGCKVHDGFQRLFRDIQQTVLSVVTGLHSAHPDYSIAVTGHSLGAALGTLSAAYLRRSGLIVDAYLFGSPRVGNEAFVNYVNSLGGNTFRITHYDDPVPRLPGHLLGYAHIDTEYWLAAGGATRVYYSPADVQVCRGTYNKDCNGGTQFLKLDFDAHLYYLQKVNACKNL